MKKILVLAIVLRVLVGAFYFHPDIKTFHFQASHLKKGVVNIYTYLVDNKKTLPLKEEFVYFPLTYFTLGSYQAIVSPLLGSNFDNWLADAGSDSNVKAPGIFWYLIILKLPYLLLDLGIAYLLYKYIEDKVSAKKAVILWLFNPFTIILFYIFGNIDIMPAFITLAAFLLMKKKKLPLAALLFGIAAGFKLYPLLFIPFLVLKGKNLKEKLILGITPLAVFAAIALPFMSKAFVDSALVSGLSTRIFNPGFNIGFSESIIVGLTLITLLFFYGAFVDRQINLVNYYVALFVIIFAFSHFHIQWLTWITPFLVIVVIRNFKLASLTAFMSVLAFSIPLLYDDRFMSIALMRVYTTLYDILPTPFQVLQKFYDPTNLQSIIHSVLAAASLTFVFLMFKKDKAHE